jgi:integrase
VLITARHRPPRPSPRYGRQLRHLSAAPDSHSQPRLVQRWLGHTSLQTTSIYGDLIGPEERAFAARMWKIGSAASSRYGKEDPTQSAL